MLVSSVITLTQNLHIILQFENPLENLPRVRTRQGWQFGQNFTFAHKSRKQTSKDVDAFLVLRQPAWATCSVLQSPQITSANIRSILRKYQTPLAQRRTTLGVRSLQ